MISYLQGKIIQKRPDQIVILCNGVGYNVEIPLTTYVELPELKSSYSIHVITHVREDAIRLFGFKTLAEKQLFEILIGISRVGPKLAMSILSGMDFSQLRQAIVHADVNALANIPGLGKKTAERILFEIKDKKLILGDDPNATMISSQVADRNSVQEVISMLVNLGYKEKVASSAIYRVKKENPDLKDLRETIKAALKIVSGRVNHE